MAPQASPGHDLIRNVPPEGSGQSSFACSHCRRQKVKCDRLLPSCGNCNKASRPCTYPLTVHKPGPKAGTRRRPRVQPSQATIDRSGSTIDHGTKRLKLDDGVVPSPPAPPVGQSVRRQSNDLRQVQREIRLSSSTASATSHSPRATSKQENPLLRIIHPYHEPEGSNPIQDGSLEDGEAAFLTRFDGVCRKLGCSREQGWDLIQAYFDSMTSFSLFHRPTFGQKVRAIGSPKQLQALLSALFSYALRFKESIASVKGTDLSAKAMLEASCQLQHECVEECLDDDPPLHLLQSLCLVTFQKLIHGVRGKTWRMLGDCIRMGYVLRLHLIDAGAGKSESDVDHVAKDESWVLSEERRRIWWALWEMDIFTSAIRKLPNAIDERLNYTFLPVTDEDWYNGYESRSCFLAADAAQRWRSVADSGNKSPQTWFILVNSYMFDAHKMGTFPEIWASRIGFNIALQVSNDEQENLVPKMRDFLDNCLRCAYMSLPHELNWEDRFLAFKASESSKAPSSRALDSARYCIHVMYQLARIMLCIWEVHHTSLSTTNPDSQHKAKLKTEEWLAPNAQRSNENVGHDRRIWDRYVDAANLIAEVIRNSSPQHYQFVNPLIANSIWFAAASLVVAKLFGPVGFDSRMAQSNFDLLVATLNQFERFWQIPSVLEHKLRSLEGTLNRLKQNPMATPRTQGTSPGPRSPAANAESPVQAAVHSLHNQQLGHSAGNECGQLDDGYAGFNQHDWTSQDFFDFNTIPTFGFGQSDLFQPTPFDANFENYTPLVLNDELNFNDLFMYPYQ